MFNESRQRRKRIMLAQTWARAWCEGDGLTGMKQKKNMCIPKRRLWRRSAETDERWRKGEKEKEKKKERSSERHKPTGEYMICVSDSENSGDAAWNALSVGRASPFVAENRKNWWSIKENTWEDWCGVTLSRLNNAPCLLKLSEKSFWRFHKRIRLCFGAHVIWGDFSF